MKISNKASMFNLFSSILLLCLGFAVNASEEVSITVSEDNEITTTIYPAKGEYLAIWIAPEYGFRKGHRLLARQLTSQSIEVWQSNILESLFLTQSIKAQKSLDGRYIADMIDIAYNKTGKKIILMGDAYATGTALNAAHQWQLRKHKTSHLKGAVLFTPYTYAYIPPLGMTPEYLPIVNATNIPLIIYQSDKSATSSQFQMLLNKLGQHNNPIYTKKIPDVMSLFYEKEPNEQMLLGAKQVSESINKMLWLMTQHSVPKNPVDIESLPNTNIKSGIDIYLKPFKGNNKPFSINLPDISGKKFNKTDFSGKVTVINFWATWCPPCVEEIPSLNRLKNKLQDKPFDLISINYAEEKKTIKDFMEKVNVEFTVLLDKNGDYAKKWKVISYPSTFIINKEGKIVYGVNAAIEWDSPELIEKINSMF